MKEYFRELLIAVLILALFWYIFEDLRGEKKSSAEYARKETAMKAKFDSVISLQHKADLNAISAMTDLTVARRELTEQSHITEKYKLRYDALKNTRAPLLSDKSIDSLVSALYPIR